MRRQRDFAPLSAQQILPVISRCCLQNQPATIMNPPLLHCRNLLCRRPLWRAGASVVRGITAGFEAGRFHAISGPEGCGKNLLLHLLGLLEQPDAGEVWLEGANATTMNQAERDLLRQRNFGFLFPVCGLLPSLSVLENIAFPLIKAGGLTESEQAEQTFLALEFCGLEKDADTTVVNLAPARQAVAAFARAIIHRPQVLIAESPSAEEVLVPLARRAIEENGLTVIWGARPDGPAARTATRVLSMSHGQLAVAAA
jgi:ABC-type lipoprotein export system ATPase subunit